MNKKVIGVLLLAVLSNSCKVTKNSQPGQGVVGSVKQSVPIDAKADSSKKYALKPYKEIITGRAITQTGLIKVHKVDDRYYFEIGDSIINKDILIVNRISKGPAAVRAGNGILGYAGDYIGENVIQFAKGPGRKLFMKRISFLEMSNDSTNNGMYKSLVNSSLQPIVASFDIKAFSVDSTGVVIDVTDFISGDNDVFFFSPAVKKVFDLGAVQPDKSYVSLISSFPLNTEIRTVKTYISNAQSLTFELNSSLVLLPASPMKSRYYDKRVGYFSRGYLNYDAPQGVEADFMITRWRLEPKPEDSLKYLAGQLVEPRKPIIFYIDPATPRKWVPYLIQGVNDWQKAFEKAGFKNAIYAMEPPKDDTAWSIEDARHNVIVYKASPLQNASGPQISDPRTGEILESHVNWYHNVQQILHDWYFIQASPSDPAARKMQFDDNLMGRLIRYVCAHEVGHTLGLQHNFAASSTIPVDSLRSKNYVAKNSHTPSIMDYARFNYVAQPQDHIAPADMIPRLGVYDEWAIEWGYKWLPQIKAGNEEKSYLNHWIINKLKTDKRYFFEPGEYPDPRNQTEDLGDDAVKASEYGIRNLQYIAEHLKEWTKSPNDDYTDLKNMYKTLQLQYRQYLTHVFSNIINMQVTPLTVEQGGTIFSFLEKKKIQNAVKFFNEYLFNIPKWLYNDEFFKMGIGGSVIEYQWMQEWFLFKLQHASTWNYLVFNETNQSRENAYSYEELLNELETEIWKELKGHQPISFTRRNLQKAYVFNLKMGLQNSKWGDMDMLDFTSIVQHHLKNLYSVINSALPGYKDAESRIHLEDLRERLKNTAEYQNKVYQGGPPGIGSEKSFNYLLLSNNLFEKNGINNNKGCWEQEQLFK